MSEEKQHIVSYKEHFGTWAGLIILTIMTVAVSVVNAKLLTLTVITALTIATTKAILVSYWYMHLKFENVRVPKDSVILVVNTEGG